MRAKTSQRPLPYPPPLRRRGGDWRFIETPRTCKLRNHQSHRFIRTGMTLAGELAQNEGQNAAMAEIFELVERIDPAQRLDGLDLTVAAI